MIRPYLIDVSSKYGAPMGRRSDPVSWFCGKKTTIVRVPMVDGDYDGGGAYWGGYPSPPLFCAWSNLPNDERVVTYVRAASLDAAKKEIPGAIFKAPKAKTSQTVRHDSR